MIPYLVKPLQNRYLDNFFNVVRLPHDFDMEQSRSLIVISKNEEMINYAREVGVSLAIGPEIVKLVQVRLFYMWLR